MTETNVRKEVKNEWIISNQQPNPETLVQKKN
jgi:hypothetical protein